MGVIEVKFLDGTSYNTTDTPNHPVLKEGMTAITYNESTGETTNVSNSTGTDWYSYVEGSGVSDNNASHWANAEVTTTVNDEEIKSYFVWIPRYAYRIIYFDSVDSANEYRAGTLTEEQALAEDKIEGYSDARGIVDTEGKTKEGVSVQTAISVDNKYFKTHPVFDGDVNYGGWAEDDGTPVKLQGIWVAKYEASSVEGNSNSSSGDNVTTKHVKIQPGVSSWRYLTIGNMFINAKNYNQSLKSHLMKNSEWGAVAYLTESEYGRNGIEITTNNNGDTYYTGGGSEISYVNNTEQSSTGNIYGIYDLSGNAYEFISGYYSAGSLSHGNLFANGISDAYSTAYNGTSENMSFFYGDATYETHGWHEDRTVFINSSNSFFDRGGHYSYEDYAGVFYFSTGTGIGGSNTGFRVCLIVQ